MTTREFAVSMAARGVVAQVEREMAETDPVKKATAQAEVKRLIAEYRMLEKEVFAPR